jgi:hypothetical protein
MLRSTSSSRCRGVHSVFQRATQTPSFAIGELAAHLDADGRRTLCLRLLAEGVLERERAR